MSTRRALPGALGAVLIAATTVLMVGPAEMASAAGVPLGELAAGKGITFGTAVSAAAQDQDTGYAARLATEFGSVTPEDAMKWAAVHPAKERFDWRAADAVVNTALGNEQEIRGHTLVWHSSLPGWLTGGTFTTDELKAILREHIQTMVTRYRGQVSVWDVVNEPLNNDGTLRPGFWLNRLGPDYIVDAFRWAHEADPDATLYLNEYGAEANGAKADALYELVKSLIAKGVPLGGVGFQAHLTGSSRPDALAAVLRRFADLGVDVAVTELDVRITTPPTTTAETSQAQVYGRVVAACLTVPRCRSITVWGFTDRHSWVPATYPGWGAATLLDEGLGAKPAYTAVADTLLASGPAAGAPAGWWRLDDPAGATVAADISGHGRDARIRGAGTGSPGRVPHMTAFTGDGATTEATTTTPVLDTAGSFTVSAWVSMTSTAIPGVVAAQDGSVRSAFYLMYQTGTNRWELTVPSADGATVTWSTARSTTVPVLNRWTHLTGVYDASARRLQLYVDGVREGTRDGVTAWASDGPFHIGRSLSGGRFPGAMSDVRAWNRALSASEVSTAGDRTVASWEFDGTSTDSSPFGRGTSLTTTGAGYTADRGGTANRALGLSGTGCAEGHGPVLATDRSYTVAAWARLADKGGSRTVLSQSGTGKDAFYLQYHQSYDRWAVLVPSGDEDTATWQTLLSTTSPALNTWTHLAAVHDAQAGTLALYVDGVRQGGPLTVATWPSTGRIHIGCSGTGGRFNGALDEIRAYASALTAGDVAALAAGTPVR
ncbi:endo-1,4-beta-xylanase [Actinoplanes sp. CA-252034]|uniref:endo-1,4-beta-xylanase n=1 Tax=Actinoplanes sp. CA-252034 TaxID=3239906 RepID=UPI003D9780D7